MTKIKNVFHDLPAPYTLKTEAGMLNFRKNIKESEIKNENNYLLQIKFLLYIKLLFHLWDVEDYKEFKRTFLNINIDKLNILGSSIIKCLESSNYTIYDELEQFSKETDWYPRKIKDLNNKIINSPIKILDSFYIVDYLEKYMNQFISKYGDILNTQIKLTDKYHDFIDENVFYQQFDENFAFLENYYLFKDVYLNVRKESIMRLSEYIHKLKSREGAKIVKAECWRPSHEAIKNGRGQTDYKNRLIRNGDIKEKHRVKQIAYSNMGKYKNY